MTAIRRAMVLAAGRGERMRPLTDRLPKPLIAVAGRSLLDRALDRLEDHGIEEVVVNAHYLAPALETHAANRPRPTIRLVREAALLDTGGGVANALPLLGAGPFFVANGDGLWLDGDRPMLRRLEEAWDPTRMDALLLLHPLDRAIGREAADRGDYFHDSDGRLRHRGDAAGAPYLFASVSIATARLFDDAPTGAFSLVKLWHRAQAAGRLFGLVHDGAWFHVGSPAALAEAERVLDNAR